MPLCMAIASSMNCIFNHLLTNAARWYWMKLIASIYLGLGEGRITDIELSNILHFGISAGTGNLTSGLRQFSNMTSFLHDYTTHIKTFPLWVSKWEFLLLVINPMPAVELRAIYSLIGLIYFSAAPVKGVCSLTLQVTFSPWHSSPDNWSNLSHQFKYLQAPVTLDWPSFTLIFMW